MYLTPWFYNIIVQLLSTHTGAQPVGITERWCKKTKQKIDGQISYVTGHYIKHMEGVDLLNSLIGFWYHTIFGHLIDIVVINENLCCGIRLRGKPLNIEQEPIARKSVPGKKYYPMQR